MKALNYFAQANTDDGSCIDIVFGCTNPYALNYNSLANTNDNSCISYVYGCTDEMALNYLLKQIQMMVLVLVLYMDVLILLH